MKENYTYDQPIKQNVRHSAIYKAVEILTTKREQSCCVERSYVKKIYDYFTLSEDISNSKVEAEKINVNYITDWEKLHDSFVGRKKPEELIVCYLCGPEPHNDFNELINLGILPQNIWAFESDSQVYKKALATYEKGEYPQPRIIKQNIETFFKYTPKKFDIVYIDACGSVLSEQHALRCVSTLCLYHRLNSPGVVITNFAMPDTQKDSICGYYETVSQYLFFKEYPDEDFKITEKGIESSKYEEFSNKVRDNFNYYYGEYISYVLRDIPSVIIPLGRIAMNPYLSQIFDLSLLGKFSDKEFINWSKGNSIARYFLTANYLEKEDRLGNKSKCFFKEIGNYDNLLKGIKIILLLRSEIIKLKEDIKNIKNFFEDKRNIYQFLDKPHSNLFFDIVLNQLSYPMHNNILQNTRYNYVAKTNMMFTDVTIYDECRYIYEWLPGLHQIISSFKDKSCQYVFRFALDGLVKMRQNYNNEFFFQGSIISNSVDGFTSKRLQKRIIIE